MMVREGDQDFYRLEGIGQSGAGDNAGGSVKITCAFQKGGRKKITIDENPVRLSKLYQLFSVVSMAPEDVGFFSGSPSARRRFMDLHLSQASPSYLADLTDYTKALAQKNSFLKSRSGEECPFDPLLVQYGSSIIAARHSFVHFLHALAPGYYDQIAGEATAAANQRFSFDYKPNVSFDTKDEIAENFEIKLVESRQKEMILETAVVGPHRDDISFRISGFPARGYGSQGEMRSGAVAVMMAAANFLESRRDEKPILLLDEIFAELDHTRRENLAALFESFEQIFLTTAIEPPEALTNYAMVFKIEDGHVLKS
jgi:DNA replication and repair protein RecF